MKPIFTMDEDPFEGSNLTNLEKHDRRFHPNGYKEGDTCRYREAIKRGDDADKILDEEKKEATENDAVGKIIDRWNKLGNLVVTMPMEDGKYEDVLKEYGIDKDSQHWQSALNAIKDAGEDFEKNGIDPDDPADTVELKKQVLALNDLLQGFTKNPSNKAPVSSQEKVDSKINNQDREDLLNLREHLENAARLLNGRAGNIQALQASSRYALLEDIGKKPKFMNALNDLMKSSDTDVANAAKKLEPILNNIQKSAKNNWNDPAGMVPPESDMPASSSASTQSTTSQSISQPAFSDDDAKAILLRVAKSINHHIDKGDFTPNANAVAKFNAAKADIANLKNPQLDALVKEIDNSLANGSNVKISNVPAPSQVWQQAHMPTQPNFGAILSALFGGTPNGSSIGTSNNSTPAVKGKFSGQTWTPFSAPSEWDKQLSSINANHGAINDPNYFKNLADAMTPSQAVSLLEQKNFIVKGGYKDSIDVNDPDEQELWAGWKPSKKFSDDTAKCAAVCFDDLLTRFPNTLWKKNLELRCGTKPFTGGQSTHTQDWRRHTVLFNCDYSNIWGGTGLGKSNYGHPDNRFPYDVLRHEMGHALISGMLPNGKRMISKWHDAMTAAYGNPANDLEKFAGKYVSSYAVTQKGKGFSMAECLSECFSLATSPDYKPGYLPPPVEDFIFGEMLGMKK